MEALQTATVRVVAVIAEGVPEKDTKRMIAYAKANGKVIIGPATVGGVQVGSPAGSCSCCHCMLSHGSARTCAPRSNQECVQVRHAEDRQ
jgi:succinyl-CoA synthetase alpha subunit